MVTPPPQDLLIAPSPDRCSDPLDTWRVRVTKVFDGDGFLGQCWHPVRMQWLRDLPFRFAFIDAPEIGQPFGEEAQAMLKRLIMGQQLELELISKESMGGVPLDSYRRVLCMGYLRATIERGPIQYFWHGRSEAGTCNGKREVMRNIELEMIVNGFAWVVRQWAFDHEEEYQAAEIDARSQRRGLWANAVPEPPWKYKQRVKQRQQRTLGQGLLL